MPTYRIGIQEICGGTAYGLSFPFYKFLNIDY